MAIADLKNVLKIFGGSDISDFSIVDELDTLNANPAFQPGTLTVTTLPAGATDNSDPTGGTAGTGLLDTTMPPRRVT